MEIRVDSHTFDHLRQIRLVILRSGPDERDTVTSCQPNSQTATVTISFTIRLLNLIY